MAARTRTIKRRLPNILPAILVLSVYAIFVPSSSEQSEPTVVPPIHPQRTTTPKLMAIQVTHEQTTALPDIHSSQLVESALPILPTQNQQHRTISTKVTESACVAYTNTDVRETNYSRWPRPNILREFHPFTIDKNPHAAYEFVSTEPCVEMGIYNLAFKTNEDGSIIKKAAITLPGILPTFHYPRHIYSGLPSHTVTDQDVGLHPDRVLILLIDGRPRHAVDDTRKDKRDGIQRPAFWSAAMDINERYASFHGYKFMIANASAAETPSGWAETWHKVFVIHSLLKSGNYDYIMFLDSDAWFMELERPLGPVLHWAGIMDDPTKSVIMTREPWFSPWLINTGVMVFKTSPSAVELLDRLRHAMTPAGQQEAQKWLQSFCKTNRTLDFGRYKLKQQREQGLLSDYIIPRFYNDVDKSPLIILPLGHPFNGMAGTFVRHLWTGVGTQVVHNVTQRDRYLQAAWMCTMCKTTGPGDPITSCPRCQDINAGFVNRDCPIDLKALSRAVADGQ